MLHGAFVVQLTVRDVDAADRKIESSKATYAARHFYDIVAPESVSSAANTTICL